MSDNHNPPAFPKIVQMWECSDGSKHYSKECADWDEEQIRNMEIANLALQDGKSVAEALRTSGYRGEIDPILETVTKDTKLIIEYWQCRETPGYQPQVFDKTRKIYVHGNAGSWSGSYGNWMNIKDLARYAQSTAHKKQP